VFIIGDELGDIVSIYQLFLIIGRIGFIKINEKEITI